MTINEGKLLVEQKVEDFQKNLKYYTSKDFQEIETRDRFIDPLFQALGWDFQQTNIPKHLWDVQREYRQKDNSMTKKPDYAFNINGKLKFFVEAKAPWVPLTDKEPIFQAKRYAFSTNGKAPIIILTDFEEFRVFNSLERPIYDNTLQGLIDKFNLRFTDYINKWDLLYENFSREAVLSGSIDELTGKITKNTKTLDKEFLNDLINFREELARHFAIKNLSLSTEEINEAVQRLLDRLIFLRNLEDREIENNILYNVLNKDQDLYKSLIIIFRNLNDDYNGLLFKKHFSEELIIDDKVLRDLIKKLYPRYSPFQFDVIEPEILGRIYERFLGSKIRLTENHRVKVEEKPEVRHAGGVFYTPQFIVDAIVKETVGRIIKGKKPEEIEQIKILDPACGSGSFLLGAYSYLIQYHVDFYTKNKLKKYCEDYFETPDGEIKLSIKKKGDILFHNIFGVDIDREATEVSIMSLYLKLLEDGFDAEYKKQATLFMKGLILPDLTKNIMCGNSLITREQLFSNDLFGDEDITPFDWDDEQNGFGKIIKENKGFDCIIGNPPYIRIQEMQKWAPKTISLFKDIYKSGGFKNYDIYVLFIEKALTLLSTNGLCGYILPNKFMQQDYGEPIRKILSEGKNIIKIINFKDFQIFSGATTYTCLLFFSKISNTKFEYAECFDNKLDCNYSKIENAYLTEQPWILHDSKDLNILNKMNLNPALSEICDNIFVGIQTSADNVFILNYISNKGNNLILHSKSLNKKVELEKKYLRHIISGVDVKKYQIPDKRQYVIFPYITENDKIFLLSKKDLINTAPLIWEYLNENKKVLENREGGKFKDHEWYRFGRNQNINKQHLRKICIPRLVKEIQAIYDFEGDYCQDNVDVGGIILKEKYKKLDYYLLGILNSKLLTFYLSKISTPFRGGFWSCNRQYLEKLPIYILDKNNKEKYELCNKIEDMVKKILEYKKNKNKHANADFLEKKIDEYVEKLYLG